MKKEKTPAKKPVAKQPVQQARASAQKTAPVQTTNGATRHAISKQETPIENQRQAEPLIVVQARINVGFGNQLYIRGAGAGLSWERGVPLGCVDDSTWRWAGPSAEPVTFKLLLNDQLWCQGSDFQAAPGTTLDVAPAF